MVIENNSDTNSGNAETGSTGSEGGIDSAVRYVTDALDSAVSQASKVIGGENGQKVAGGAAVGAIAAIVLPFSIGVGALLGAGYAIYRQSRK